MNRERVLRCLGQVKAYRESGQKAAVWSAANGVRMKDLESWCAHSARWQDRLDGVRTATSEGRAKLRAIKVSRIDFMRFVLLDALKGRSGTATLMAPRRQGCRPGKSGRIRECALHFDQVCAGSLRAGVAGIRRWRSPCCDSSR